MKNEIIFFVPLKSYMEEHLRNRDRLDADWEEINAYESEEAVPCESARRPENAQKNREGCPVPCECACL